MRETLTPASATPLAAAAANVRPPKLRVASSATGFQLQQPQKLRADKFSLQSTRRCARRRPTAARFDVARCCAPTGVSDVSASAGFAAAPKSDGAAAADGDEEDEQSSSKRTLEAASAFSASRAAMSEALLEHSGLRHGRLPNGLEYFILPSEYPRERFEVHLEVFAGSTVEREDQQGIAHVVEHVAYMGSEKREQLISGTGASTNAHTDFNHTVFFAACPTRAPRASSSQSSSSQSSSSQSSSSPTSSSAWQSSSSSSSAGGAVATAQQPRVLPMALDALLDVMSARIEAVRVEKERAAILSEMLMVNTMEYRVECQLLASLHAENIIPRRFPIGLEEQIRRWNVNDVREFHREHYRPDNAVLYVVGDFGGDGVEDVEALVAAKFGHLERRSGAHKAAENGGGGGGAAGLTLRDTQSRHFPAVGHRWSDGSLRAPTDVRVYRHELLSSFSLHLYAKSPIEQVRSRGAFRRGVLRKLGYSALQIRLNMAGRSDELAGESPFSSVEFLDQDSPREACEVRSLDLTARAASWHSAVRVAVRELRRFARFGLSPAEFERQRLTFLHMARQALVQGELTPTSVHVEDLMDAVAAGHVYLSTEDYYRALEREVMDIGLDEMNAYAAQMTAHARWFEPGGAVRFASPNSVVACAPASLGSDFTREALLRELFAAGAEEVSREADVDVPEALMDDEELAQLREHGRGRYEQWRLAPHGGVGAGESSSSSSSSAGGEPSSSDAPSLLLARLNNGLRLNALRSTRASGRCCLRLTCTGGRAWEGEESGVPEGAVALGAAALQEGGATGRWSREQVELFCIDHLIEVYVHAAEDSLQLDLVSPSDRIESVLQIVRGLMLDFRWEEDALQRGRERLRQAYYDVASSLEEASRAALLHAMTGGDARMALPTPHALDALRLRTVAAAVGAQLVPRRSELSFVGDVEHDYIAELVRVYLGSIDNPAPSDGDGGDGDAPPLSPVAVGAHGRALSVQLSDTDPRAVVYVAGAMPNAWGFRADGSHVTLGGDGVRAIAAHAARGGAELVDGKTLAAQLARDVNARRSHPLFAYVGFGMLREVITRRMFSELREEANLSYEANFKVHSFDHQHGGFYVATATAAPLNAARALAVVRRTLSALRDGRSAIRWSNVENARRSVLSKHDAGMENDGYVVQLLSGMQLPSCELKTDRFLHDLVPVTESITVDDVRFLLSTMSLGEHEMYTCVGVSEGGSGEEDAGDGADDSNGEIDVGDLPRAPPRGGSTALWH